MQAIDKVDVRRVVGTSATWINNFVHWFQAILANMNPEAQRRALAAPRKAASSSSQMLEITKLVQLL